MTSSIADETKVTPRRSIHGYLLPVLLICAYVAIYMYRNPVDKAALLKMIESTVSSKDMNEYVDSGDRPFLDSAKEDALREMVEPIVLSKNMSKNTTSGDRPLPSGLVPKTPPRPSCDRPCPSRWNIIVLDHVGTSGGLL